MAWVLNKGTARYEWHAEPGQPTPPGPPPGGGNTYDNYPGKPGTAPAGTWTTGGSTVTAGPVGSPTAPPTVDLSKLGLTKTGSTINPAAFDSTQKITFTPSQPATTVKPTAPTSGWTGTVAPATPGTLTTPGLYEQWYAQNKAKYSAPSQTQSYYDTFQNRYGSEGFQPTNTANAYSVMTQNLMQPNQGVEAARSATGQLMGPSQGEGYLSQAAGYFQGPNMTSTYAGGLDPRAFNQAGASENYFGTAAPQLAGRGAGEANVYAQMPAYQQRGAAEYNNDRAMSQLVNNNNARDAYGQMVANNFTGQNTTGDELDFFRPSLRDTSDSEDLYASGNDGLNTFYDREYQKRSRRLQDQMAAMGVFGSGATGRGLYELEGELGAAQARDMASLAAQSDQARLARAGAAESFAKSAGAEEMARYGQGFQAAMGADESTRGNVAAGTDAATAAQQMQLQRMFQGGQLGLEADQAGRDRLALGGDLATASDTAKMNRLSTGADIYKAADESRFAQGEGLAATGNLLGTQSTNRLKTAADVGLAADVEDRARLNDMFGAAKDFDQGRLTGETFNRDTAGIADNQFDTRLAAGSTAAQTAQNMFEKRERYPVQDQLQMAQAMSGMVERARSASTTEQGAIREQMIQTLIQQGNMTRTAAEQDVDNMYRNAGIGITGFGQVQNNLPKTPATVTPTAPSLNLNPFGRM